MDATNDNFWRSGLPQDSRQKIVKRIMDPLQRHMPPTGQESMGELLKIACRIEEKIFHAATDQQDYLRKISLKMLSLETMTQASATAARLGNPAGVVKSLDAGLDKDFYDLTINERVSGNPGPPLVHSSIVPGPS